MIGQKQFNARLTALNVSLIVLICGFLQPLFGDNLYICLH
ncbi:MAG: hypothetical protein RIT03_1995 [Bacteroidota bacterium]|jgi:hypothetical protein